MAPAFASALTVETSRMSFASAKASPSHLTLGISSVRQSAAALLLTQKPSQASLAQHSCFLAANIWRCLVSGLVANSQLARARPINAPTPPTRCIAANPSLLFR
jgi:hypothetical protein